MDISKKNNLQTINAREGVDKRESSHTVVGNVNCSNCYGEGYEDSLKKKKQLKIELPYIAIPLLDIYLEKTMIQKGTTKCK